MRVREVEAGAEVEERVDLVVTVGIETENEGLVVTIGGDLGQMTADHIKGPDIQDPGQDLGIQDQDVPDRVTQGHVVQGHVPDQGHADIEGGQGHGRDVPEVDQGREDIAADRTQSPAEVGVMIEGESHVHGLVTATTLSHHLLVERMAVRV